MPDSQPHAGHGFFFGFISFLGRFGGIIRSVAIAALFGATIQTDAYRLAFQAPEWLFFLIFAPAIGSAFTPVFSELIATGKEREAWELFSVIATLIIVLGVVVFLFGGPALPAISALLAPGKSPETIRLVFHTAAFLMPALWLMGLGSLLYSLLYALGRLAIPGLGSATFSLGIFFGALIGSGTGNVEIIAQGATAGAVFGYLVLPLMGLRGVHLRFRFSLDFKAEGVRLVLANLIRDCFLFGAPVLLIITMQLFATYFPAGSNTILEYATQVAWLPVLIFGIPLANALSPALEHLGKSHRPDLQRTEFVRVFTTLCFLVFPLCASVLALAPQISMALFEHGRFTHEQALACASLLRWFSVGMAAWAMLPLFSRALVVVTDGASAALVCLLSPLLLSVIVVAFGSKATPLWFVPLGFTIAACVLGGVLFFMCAGNYGSAVIVPAAVGKAKAFACAAVTGGVLYGLALVLRGPLSGPFLWPLLLLLLLAGAWINLLMGKLLRMPEAGFVAKAM